MTGNPRTKPVAVIGAGITGLTAGFYLKQRGFPVVIYEASDRTGGMIQTSSYGGFLAELGPNTIMTNSVAVPRIIKDLGLESRRLLPSANAATRYIARNGRPVPVPQSVVSAIGTGLLSLRAKLRVLGEPFVAQSSGADESLAEFVRRRLGGEFLDYLIDPFIAGVYAGDPERLSIVHALPKMAALERNYGSLIKGAVLGAKERRERNAPLASEPRMFSLDGGLRVLPDTLAGRLGDSILLNCPVDGIERVGREWRIHSPALSESYSSIVVCTPAHRLPSLHANADLASELKSFEHVYYPPIARLALGFRRAQVAHPLDGFGVLVPRRERMSILGALFSSSMFENRAPRDHVLLTVFAGGARNPELLYHSADQIAQLALDDLRGMLGISGAPVFADVIKLGRSIPQYNVGYAAVKGLVARLETNNPGLYFAGNFCHGISVSDCIASGAAAAERVTDPMGRGMFRVPVPSEVTHV
jgi:oxygen-dependent protoporphyrinogen oxidase